MRIGFPYSLLRTSKSRKAEELGAQSDQQPDTTSKPWTIHSAA